MERRAFLARVLAGLGVTALFPKLGKSAIPRTGTITVTGLGFEPSQVVFLHRPGWRDVGQSWTSVNLKVLSYDTDGFTLRAPTEATPPGYFLDYLATTPDLKARVGTIQLS